MEMRDCCYDCQYRRAIAGSCHSNCNHPAASNKTAKEDLAIKGDQQGIDGGWFNWPFNFDPVWLENCNGFKSKTAQDAPV